jgi:hypothetical protein
MRDRMTYGGGSYIMLIKAITEANPECKENDDEGNGYTSNPTCMETYSPQGSYKCVETQELERDSS